MGDGTTCHYCNNPLSLCECPDEVTPSPGIRLAAPDEEGSTLQELWSAVIHHVPNSTASKEDRCADALALNAIFMFKHHGGSARTNMKIIGEFTPADLRLIADELEVRP